MGYNFYISIRKHIQHENYENPVFRIADGILVEYNEDEVDKYDFNKNQEEVV